MFKQLGLVTLLSVGLIACHRETIHDVAWWKAHGSDRKDMIARCENNPGLMEHNPNCENSEQALSDMMFDHHGSLPHLPS